MRKSTNLHVSSSRKPVIDGARRFDLLMSEGFLLSLFTVSQLWVMNHALTQIPPPVCECVCRLGHVSGKPRLFLTLLWVFFCHISSEWSRQDTSRQVEGGTIPPKCLRMRSSVRLPVETSVREPGWSLSLVSGTVALRSGPGRRASDLWWVRKHLW